MAAISAMATWAARAARAAIAVQAGIATLAALAALADISALATLAALAAISGFCRTKQFPTHPSFSYLVLSNHMAISRTLKSIIATPFLIRNESNM